MNIFNVKQYTTALLVTLLMAGLTGNAAYAEDSIRLTSSALQETVETDDAGNRTVKRVAAKKVVPGDEVIYLIEFENAGTEAADNIVIQNPVPEHTIYKSGSASGANTDISYSVDGGKNFDSPEKLVVTRADGSTGPATADTYTAIRWRYEESLPPGEKSSVEYRVVIR